MIEEVQKLLDQHGIWLRGKTTLRQVDDWIEITTPYLDRHNDCLQIYTKRADGGFLLTDDGYTIEDLEQSGCKIDGGRRRALLHTTLNGFGVNINATALEVRASSEDFALRKHNLIQAMLAVNDLFYLASSVISSLFHEDSEAWLGFAKIRSAPNMKYGGRSGYRHWDHFGISESKGQSETAERYLLYLQELATQTVQKPERVPSVVDWLETGSDGLPIGTVRAGFAPTLPVDAGR